MKNNHDTHSVISNDIGIVFATQKEWQRLPADELSVLTAYSIVSSQATTGSIYMILRNMSIIDWKIRDNDFLMLKITTSEETGRVDFYTMELTAAEAALLKDTPLPLWE